MYLTSFRVCDDMSAALIYAGAVRDMLERSEAIHFHRHDDGKVSVSRLQSMPLYAGQSEFKP